MLYDVQRQDQESFLFKYWNPDWIHTNCSAFVDVQLITYHHNVRGDGVSAFLI